MNTFNSIIARAKHIRSGVAPTALMNPLREWMIGLCVALSVLVGAGVYAFNLFLQSHKEVVISDVNSPSLVSYDVKKIEKVLEVYRARRTSAENFENTKVALPPIIEVPESAVKTEPVANLPPVQVE